MNKEDNYRVVEELNAILFGNGLIRTALDNSLFQNIKNRKIILVELRGGACEICGYRKSLSALDFHHINSETKNFNIGIAIQTFSDRQFEEILILKVKKECRLLCANCHREVHEGIKRERKRRKERFRKIKEAGLLGKQSPETDN